MRSATPLGNNTSEPASVIAERGGRVVCAFSLQRKARANGADAPWGFKQETLYLGWEVIQASRAFLLFVLVQNITFQRLFYFALPNFYLSFLLHFTTSFAPSRTTRSTCRATPLLFLLLLLPLPFLHSDSHHHSHLHLHPHPKCSIPHRRHSLLSSPPASTPPPPTATSPAPSHY